MKPPIYSLRNGLGYKIETYRMKANSQGFLDLMPFPNKKLIHNDPPIYYIDNFLSQNECQYIISLSERSVQTSRVVDKVSGVGIEHPSRTSQSCYHGYDIKWLVARVARLLSVPKENQEPTQVARYTSGQFYLSHQDAIDNPPEDKGQRIATVLMYLNNVPSGGGTFFNNLK